MPADLLTRIAQLSSGSANEQAAAAEALARLGPAARPAAVALVEACGSGDDAVREWCVAALEELGRPPAGQIDRLIQLARDTQLDVAYWAITMLGRAGDDAAPGVAALVDVVLHNPQSPLRERAAWALGKIGPTAQAAVPALREAAANGQSRLSRLAHSALSAIIG